MYPELFRIPGLGWPINSYGFMIMIGFLLATYVAVRRGRQLGMNSDLILDVGIISMIFGIIGAKVNYVLQYGDQYPPKSFNMFDLGDGGFSVLGGLILGPIPLALWYWRTKGSQKLTLVSWQNIVLLVLTILCTLLGARILYLWMNRGSDQYDWALLKGWQSGFVLYGGLVAGMLAGAVYTRMRGESIGRMGDVAAPSMMLGLVFGRLGCLLNGCCWGKPTTLPWGLRFPEASAASGQILRDQLDAGVEGLDHNATAPLPVHPTMIYESLAALAIFLFLSWWWRKRKNRVDGEIFLLLGMCYPAWRFFVEFLRGDKRPNWIGSLSYSQSLGLGIFILSAVWLFLLKNRPKLSAEKTGLASADTPKAEDK